MYSNSMSCVKPVDILTALRLILNSSPYLLKKIPFKVSELDGSMWEELKQNKQKRKDKCSNHIIMDILMECSFVFNHVSKIL